MEKFPLKYGCADRAPKGKEYALFFKDTLPPQNINRKILKKLKKSSYLKMKTIMLIVLINCYFKLAFSLHFVTYHETIICSLKNFESTVETCKLLL